MNNTASALTILTCYGPARRAAKKFIMLNDGSIKKESFKSGMYFTHEECPVSDLAELSLRLDELAYNPRKSVIRGKIKKNMAEVVQRKKHNPDAAFDPIARPYVMLDFDKQRCPDHLDPSTNPLEIVAWIQNMLPEDFRDTSCYYKFSSSQNVYPKIKGENTASIHLWYWCEKSVSDDEWKRYFRSVGAPVDSSLFDAVQMHYTANPIFENMADPLLNRSGIYKGKSDVLIVPEIPEAQVRRTLGRVERQLKIDQSDQNKALELLLPYYQEGKRNTLCGAVAATLYRGGWAAENSATFVYKLAESASDEEADERYSSALRICQSVDLNLPAQGIPKLKKDLVITNLKEILDLLGLGVPDLDKELARLNNKSTPDDLREVMRALVNLPEGDRDFYIDRIKSITKLTKKVLQSILNEVASDGSPYDTVDLADQVVQGFLEVHFEGGKHFLRSSDKRYWFYNKFHWEEMPDDFVKKYILDYAREFLAENELYANLSALITASENILEGHSYEAKDPFKLINRNMPLVSPRGTLPSNPKILLFF